MLRTLLPALVCASSIIAAVTPDHPLYFEERSRDFFETRAAGQVIALRPDRIELDGVTLRFVGASRSAKLEGIGRPAPSTYITRGLTRTFQQYPNARIQHLYPGIDVTFYGHTRQLEYDLNLARGAKSSRIRMQVIGARNMKLDGRGNLIVETRSGELRQFAPRVFQSIRGVRREITAKYVLLPANKVGFQLADHDPMLPVTIDPVVVYAKYFGGSGYDTGGPAATDAQGNVYVTGSTNSIDFPSTNGTKVRLQPPLFAYSNAGQTVTAIPVGTQTSVTAIGGTTDGNILYVATPDGIFYSGDSGTSFSQATPLTPSGTVNAISVDQIDPSRAWVATSAGLFSMNSNGQLAGLNDAGMATIGNGTIDAASVEINPTNHEVAYATTTQPNYLYVTTNAGAFWQQLFPSYPGETPPSQFSGTSITFTLTSDGSELYVIDGNGILFGTTDEGMTWQKLSGQYFFGAKSITVDPKNSSTLYVADNAGLGESMNGGNTFTTISPPLAPGVYVKSFAIDGTGALYFLTNGGQIQVSTNNGATWTILPPRPNVQTLVGLGGQVFAGAQSASVPFVTKWSPDGSQLLYSTFFGGSYSDAITGIAVDNQGEAIIAGNAFSPDFPVTHTISPATPTPGSGFVAKLSPDGSQAVYSGIFGASQGLRVNALAIDSTGAPYITGNTASPDFLTTSNAFQPKLPAAMCQRQNQAPLGSNGNLDTYAFVSKLSQDGSSFTYSTFLTGACGSVGQGIAVDSADEAVVVGYTTSPDFPVSSNAYQSVFPGGPAASVAFPSPIDFGFVTKLDAGGDKLVVSSFIGGGFSTVANALALDASGDAYITGSTSGITPGATPGAYQTSIEQGCLILGIGPSPPSAPTNGFVLKLNPAFSVAQFLTYIGMGCFATSGNSIVLDASGDVWVGGVAGPLIEPFALTGSYAVSELSTDASQLLFSSYSDGYYLARDPTGEIYISGSGVPVSGKTSSDSVSLVKIDPANQPSIIINSIGPSATYQTVANPGNPSPSTIAPGELIGIVGQHLGPSTTVMAQLDSTGRLPYVVDSTSVFFNGYLAPLISVQDGLIVCFAPFEISGPTDVTVTVDGQSSTPIRVAVAPVSTYILSILNQDGTPNSATHPAPQGSVVAVYVTGLGLTSPLSQDGSVSAPPLPVPTLPVSVSINGTLVQPQFIAAADGLVAGITQINAQVPIGNYSATHIFLDVNSAEAQIYVSASQ